VVNAAQRDGATNVLVQSQCPLRVVAHLGLALDGTVYDGVRDALRAEAVRLDCWAL
jgi:triacylglycerol lipase